MNDAQVQIAASVIAGLEAALVHIGNVLDRQGVISRADLAAGYRDTARMLPESALNRDIVGFILNHLADGTEGAGTTPPSPDPAPILRLIQGGKEPER